MRKFVALFLLLATQVFGYYPRASIGGSEIIGGLEEGLLILLPDFVFDGSKTDKGSPCLRYRSRLFPEAEFVFIRDTFNHPFYLEDYADWFTQADAPFYLEHDRTTVYAGADGRTPMLLQRWENLDSYYFQLYFGRGSEGFCCFVYLPKPLYENELAHWTAIFNNLPHQIQMIH
ncbi:MAG: hypothetical protein P0S96_00645 [Simkaniaceae bacterium]|nr:hypothetical protein [Candidatus Sacchlamyda saccharinae]